MKSSAFFVSFIDVESPWKERLLTYSPEIRERFHNGFMNALGEIALKYNGKLVHRFEERFACYFLQTSDRTNLTAFEDALHCTLEQRDRMGSLSYENLRLGISKISYRICANYEMLNFETNLEEAFDRSIQYPHIDKMCWIGLASSILLSKPLYEILITFSNIREHFNFRKRGEYMMEDKGPYTVYALAFSM